MLEGRGLPGNFRVAGARWGGWWARCRRRPNPTSLCWKGILPGNPRKVGTRGWPNRRRRPNPTSLCWKGMAFLGIPGRLGRAVGESGPTAAVPAQPAYAGRARPPWESQEGWDARLAKPPPPQPDQLMLEGRDLPGNPRKVGTRDWRNRRRRANPTSLCWKGMAFLGIPGRLGRAVGKAAAAPAQPAYAGRARPSWESQEGWDARLAQPPPPPQPDQLMLEGDGLPGNPRKVGTRGWRKWPNHCGPSPTSLCWKGATSPGIPGRLVRLVGQTAAALTRPAYAGRVWPPWESQEG